MDSTHITRFTPTTEYGRMGEDESPFPMALRASAVLAPIVAAKLQIVEERSRWHNLSVYHTFNAPIFSGVRTFEGPERDWHLMPLAEDPAFTSKNGFPMPREVIAQLRKIDAADLGLSSLYIAHETPHLSGYLPGPAKLSALFMPPPSAKAQQKASSMGQVAATLVKAAFAPALLSGALGMAALAAPLALGALVGLDPIIFGVITDPKEGLQPGSMAAWVYLCHWAWE